MANRDEQNEMEPEPAATAPAPRGSANNDSEQAQPFPEAFEACDAEAVQGWIGRQFSAASEAALLKASGVTALRAVRTGEVISMDYRTDRLTIELDEANAIVALRCG